MRVEGGGWKVEGGRWKVEESGMRRARCVGAMTKMNERVWRGGA
jgi:hypothetical protein